MIQTLIEAFIIGAQLGLALVGLALVVALAVAVVYGVALGVYVLFRHKGTTP